MTNIVKTTVKIEFMHEYELILGMQEKIQGIFFVGIRFANLT